MADVVVLLACITGNESARQARDDSGDPTWLAYTLCADPVAMVSTPLHQAG